MPQNTSQNNGLGWICLTPIILIVLFFVLMFPYSLYINVMALIDGYSASRELSGEPGTVTILKKSTASSSRGSNKICLGEFIPAHGNIRKDVIIHSPKPCEIGKTLPARFVEGRTSILSGYDQDSAWIAGSNDWISYLLLTLLFGLLTALTVLPIILGPFIGLFKKQYGKSSS